MLFHARKHWVAHETQRKFSAPPEWREPVVLPGFLLLLPTIGAALAPLVCADQLPRPRPARPTRRLDDWRCRRMGGRRIRPRRSGQASSRRRSGGSSIYPLQILLQGSSSALLGVQWKSAWPPSTSSFFDVDDDWTTCASFTAIAGFHQPPIACDDVLPGVPPRIALGDAFCSGELDLPGAPPYEDDCRRSTEEPPPSPYAPGRYGSATPANFERFSRGCCGGGPLYHEPISPRSSPRWRASSCGVRSSTCARRRGMVAAEHLRAALLGASSRCRASDLFVAEALVVEVLAREDGRVADLRALRERRLLRAALLLRELGERVVVGVLRVGRGGEERHSARHGE